MKSIMSFATRVFLATCLVTGLAACSKSQTATEDVAAHDAPTRMGSHGMAVIGDTNLLLVHMALYRRPHDRQILTPAKFRSPDEGAAFADWRADYDGLVSIVPEAFDLDRLAPDAADPISTFFADIYEGHFERGGTLKFGKVRFDLERPVLHLPVTADPPAEETYTYLLTGDRAYLVRHIGPMPGKDEIISVIPSEQLRSGERLKTRSRSNIDAAVSFEKEDGTLVSLNAETIAYLETMDFAAPM